MRDYWLCDLSYTLQSSGGHQWTVRPSQRRDFLSSRRSRLLDLSRLRSLSLLSRSPPRRSPPPRSSFLLSRSPRRSPPRSLSRSPSFFRSSFLSSPLLSRSRSP